MMDEQLQEPVEAGDEGGVEAPKIDPRLAEVHALIVARVRDGLAKVAQDLDAALKADPVQGAVQYGTMTLRSVVNAAAKAGKKLPVAAILAAGMTTIQDLATIANEKGYLEDGQLEVFMKEAWQQSIAQYAKMDMDEGVLDPKMAEQLKSKIEAEPGAEPAAEPQQRQPGAKPRGVLSGA